MADLVGGDALAQFGEPAFNARQPAVGVALRRFGELRPRLLYLAGQVARQRLEPLVEAGGLRRLYRFQPRVEVGERALQALDGLTRARLRLLPEAS